MYIAPHISASLLVQTMTPSRVHSLLQSLENSAHDYGYATPIYSIAKELCINTDELSQHIQTLENLQYIRFADRTHETIKLTMNGKCTVVPQYC